MRIVSALAMLNETSTDDSPLPGLIDFKDVIAVKIGFIGAGKVGFSLGRYFRENGLDVIGYFSRSQESAQQAADFTAGRAFDSIEQILSSSDTLFITVPDGAIVDVWECVKDLDVRNKNICHCSGSMPSTAFFDAQNKGAYVYSVHPLYAVNDKYSSWKNLHQAYFCIEGSAGHMDEIKALFARAGNTVITMDTGKKALYHAAAVTASNLSTALLQTSADMLVQCGFDEAQAKEALLPLFLGNAGNIARCGIEDALTGPVERNDVSTVQRHLAAFEQLKAPSWEMLYRILSLRLTAVAERKHSKDSGKNCDYTEMKGILTKHE